MSKRVLHIVDGAYRATLEEQDDPVVWLCRAMRSAGGELDLLLHGNAVVYGVRAQEVEPLVFGERRQRHAPDLAGELEGFLGQEASCFYVEEDPVERGIAPDELLDGLVPVSRAKLAELFSGYDQVHRW
jgi:hypothetical protein